MKNLNVTNLVLVVPAASINYEFVAVEKEATSIQVYWTSTTASFAYIIQSSNDRLNWTDVNSSQAILNNNGSTHTQIKGVRDAPYYRVSVTKTSGTLTTLGILVANQIR